MHDVSKLPKWAQKRLKQAEDELARLSQAHAVLMNREWFVLSGPHPVSGRDSITFWMLSEDGAHSICSLGRGDVLLVGRAKKGGDA